MTDKMTFAYIRDPKNENRVVTVGWKFVEVGPSVVRYSLTVNKVVPPDSYAVDGRLAAFLPASDFKALKKAMRRRYGGDNHSRKIARKVVTGRVTSEAAWLLEIDKDRPTVSQIIADFASLQFDIGAPAYLHQAFRIFSDVLPIVVKTLNERKEE